VKPTLTDSERSLIALSLAAFVVAGVANTSFEAGAQSIGSMIVAVLGVYGFARYARLTSREHLARLSLSLWLIFLGIAAVHLVGVHSVAGMLSLSVAIFEPILMGLTWGTLLGAATSSAFLGFREYGSPQRAAVDSSVSR